MSLYFARAKLAAPFVFERREAYFRSDVWKEAVKWLFWGSKFHGNGSFGLGRVNDG